MSDITTFDYDGQSISFEFADGNQMVNATQMAALFPTGTAHDERYGKVRTYHVEILQEIVKV